MNLFKKFTNLIFCLHKIHNTNKNKLFRNNLFFLLFVFICSYLAACNQHHQNSPIQNSHFTLTSTNHSNSLFGHLSRCNIIYKNKKVNLISARSISCNNTPMENLFGFFSINSPGIYHSSIDIITRILNSNPQTNDDGSLTIAGKIKKRLRIFLENLMSSYDHPIHPASFFATIKDYETSTNILQWGKKDFSCQTSKMCTKKCVSKDDCQRWCTRKANYFNGYKNCLKSCEQDPNNVCDDRCYGLFQVDPEIENFYYYDGNSQDLILWNEKNLHWDLQKVCGKKGLNILGHTAGPDYCALFFWFLIGENGKKCQAFALDRDRYETLTPEGKLQKKVLNPCLSKKYTWTKKNLEIGHIAYQQSHNISHPWVKKYYGYINDQKKHIYGYEHCAAEGFDDFKNIFFSSAYNPVPKEAIFKSVLDYGCKINVIPRWAKAEDCVR